MSNRCPLPYIFYNWVDAIFVQESSIEWEYNFICWYRFPFLCDFESSFDLNENFTDQLALQKC